MRKTIGTTLALLILAASPATGQTPRDPVGDLCAARADIAVPATQVYHRRNGATIVFVLAHAAWVGSLSFLTFTCLSKLDLLRVPRHMEGAAAKIEMQQESMDDSVHLGEAYEPAVSPATQAAAAGLPSAA